MPYRQLPLLPLILDRVPAGLTAALEQEGVPHRSWRLGAPQGRFLLYDRRQGASRPAGPGQIPIDVDRFRPAFSEDPFLALENEQVEIYQWFFQGAEILHPRGRVDRRAVRRKLLDLLRAEIEAADGIWLCLAPYPFPYRSALNVRLDHPHYEPETFDAARHALAGNESAASHFFQIAEFYPHPEALSLLRDFDLGILGGVKGIGDWGLGIGDWTGSETGVSEREFSPLAPRPSPLVPRQSLTNDAQNLEYDLELMRRVGLAPEGFLPPGGRYQPTLPPLLRRIEFPYVVLDDLGADDIPFFSRSGSVLHVPSHPISLQTLLATVEDSGFRIQGSGDSGEWPVASGEYSRSETPVSERGKSFLIPNPQSLCIFHSPLATRHSFLSAYFAETIRQKYQVGEPMFFQGQVPGGWGSHPEVLRRLFDCSREYAAVWKTTLSQFARWWRSRSEVRLTVVEHDDFYLLSAEYLPHQCRLGVEYHRGRHVARMEIARRVLRFSPTALAYENHRSEPAFPPVRWEGPQRLLSPNCRLTTKKPNSPGWKSLLHKAARLWKDAG